jgi:hypothetical protein
MGDTTIMSGREEKLRWYSISIDKKWICIVVLKATKHFYLAPLHVPAVISRFHPTHNLQLWMDPVARAIYEDPVVSDPL